MTSTLSLCYHGLWCHAPWLEAMDLFLKFRQICPLSCVSVFMKEFRFSHLLWDVSAINTAKDDMPNCGNSNILLVQPSRALLSGASQDSVIPELFSANIKKLITLSLLKNVIRSNNCVSQTNVYVNLFDKEIAITFFTITASLEGLLRLVYCPY